MTNFKSYFVILVIGKGCHRFWLGLCHAVILISNVQTSASGNEPDAVDLNSNGLDHCVRKNQGT